MIHRYKRLRNRRECTGDHPSDASETTAGILEKSAVVNPVGDIVGLTMTIALDQHLEFTPNVRGGRPRIAGRRITVDDIVIMHFRLAQSVDEIVAKYDLSYGDVHAALAYYYDHKDEIDQQIAQDDAYVEAFKRDNPSKLHEKLKALRDD